MATGRGLASDAGRAEPATGARYLLDAEIAHGGMATIHLGRLLGSAGFAKTVAIKRLLPQYEKDPAFVSMFLTEARLAARIRHPNVVSIVDVVAQPQGLLLVMEYIEGVSLASLTRAPIEPSLVVAVLAGALHGLHAAHEAKTENGRPLHIVHRDVSPQNIVVGVDGIARVLDFGIAKAASVSNATREGHTKGKFPYMAPEQLRSDPVDRRTDVYAAGVVLWEALTGARLFRRDSPAAICHAVLQDEVPAPSTVRPELPRALDAIVMRALARRAEDRFSTALEAAIALEDALAPAKARDVGEWVQHTARETLAIRARLVSALETGSDDAAFAASAEAPTGLPAPRGPALVASPTRSGGDEATFAIDTGNMRRATARRRSRIAAAGVILVASAVAGLALATKDRRGAAENTDRALESAADVGDRPDAGPASEPPNPSSTSADVVTAEAPSALPSSPSSAIRLPAAPRAPALRPKPSGTAPKPGCSPPYVRDAQGVKIYKRECLTE